MVRPPDVKNNRVYVGKLLRVAGKGLAIVQGNNSHSYIQGYS